MRKINFGVTLLILVVFRVFSQPYGETNYNNSSTLTCAGTTSIHSPGFIMAGLSGSNIHIDKTGSGGVISGANNFQKDYQLLIDGVCTSDFYPTPLGGVSVIETNGMLAWYALAGAYHEACFLSFLNSAGTQYKGFLFPFPYSSTVIEKPHIIQSQTSSDFFICGKFDTSMYVMRVDTAGSLLWSKFYDAGLGYTGSGAYGGMFRPLSMIESPFNGDLAIAGYLYGPPSYNRENDGFFLSLNSSNGTVNTFKSYGDYGGTSSPCQSFNSVIPAYSAYGGAQGYILSGDSDPIGTTTLNIGRAWIMKVDVSGNIIWNYFYTGDPNNHGQVYDVVERHNPLTSHYEYYALSFYDQYNGSSVYKLTDDGLPFSLSHPTAMDLFIYPSPSTSSIVNPLAITHQQGTGNDNGIHLYANDNTNYYLTEAYFNGVAGCNENRMQIETIEQGLNYITPWILTYGGPSYCPDTHLVDSQTSITPNVICSNNVVAGGSNSKITGINENTNSTYLKVYPNPGNGNYTIDIESSAEMQIYNFLGELLIKENLNKGKNKIDLTNYKNGLYFVNIIDGGRSQTIQLIKN